MKKIRKLDIALVTVALAIAVQLGIAIYVVATGADLPGAGVPVLLRRTLLF